MMSKTSGIAPVIVIAILAALGIGAWAVKPSIFPGQSRRAEQSTQATANLEQATNARGSAAAASVVKIGEANAEAEPSPSKDFIARETGVALALLPAPDAQKLIEAERRKSAVMEGRAEEARKLYEQSAKTADRLQRERDEALAARRNADLALERAAAAEHARTMQAIGAGVVAMLFLAAFAYVKLYGISATAAGRIAADIRAGENPLHALDVHTAPRVHAAIKRAAKLNAKHSDE